MKANSLSISLPWHECNQNCAYCVSKMTGYGCINRDAFIRNLSKAKKMADIAGVTSVILTGKGEPLYPFAGTEDHMTATTYLRSLKEVCDIFADYPLEIQTNGKTIMLENSEDFLPRKLLDMHINTIAISVDDPNVLLSIDEVIHKYLTLGFNLRVTINLTKRIMKFPATDYVKACKDNGISQLSFRELTIPDYAVDSKASQDAQKYIQGIDKAEVHTYLNKFFHEVETRGQFVRSLDFGANIYMIDGVSCVVMGKCIQENSDDSDIRSLIYWEDGHMSTSWYGSNFGRLF